MTPEQFIHRWRDNPLTERAGAQAHFDDLCELLGVDKPRDRENYCFERGAKKTGGGDGWADVWKRDHFAWENKSPKRDLVKALEQLRAYAGNLDNPPLHIVCDRERIEIHTVFRGYPDEPRTILLKDIGAPANLQTLRWVFTDPDKLKPKKSNAAITQDVAAEFAELAKSMRNRGLDAQKVAHFLTQCIFCMFSEDEGLLHEGQTDNPNIFTTLLKSAQSDTAKAATRIATLFAAMQQGGAYGSDDITWFNGGLFAHIDIPPLLPADLACLHRVAAEKDWRAIDPTIFGTLFESGLDPDSRAELGAHFTDVATIQKIIDPLITRPLAVEWQTAKATITAALAKGTPRQQKVAANAYHAYLERLRNFRVLDAACGSGNFLYLALHALKALEHAAQLDAEALGLQQQLGIECGTINILGLEINEYAAELARVTVWIGDLQWCQRNGRPIHKRPVLHSLDAIEHRDALLNADGTEASWPKADVLVGNPPFLGDKRMRSELGDVYTETLRKTYEGRVPGGADLVCYWFEKARTAIASGTLGAAGLVATNSIRGGKNRVVLDAVCKNTRIFEAWSDEDWINEGAAVRVSLVCFGAGAQIPMLDGHPVTAIAADLKPLNGSSGCDITQAQRLTSNHNACFVGTSKKASFDIPGDRARSWLAQPNPNGLGNAQVVKPWINGSDLVRTPSDTWIVDFGVNCTESDASLFEAPFDHVKRVVKPEKEAVRNEAERRKWWLHARTAPDMRAALIAVPRFIATSIVAKHRLWVWRPTVILASHAVCIVARADDTTFGILHSRMHELWSLRMGTSLEDRPRYTPTTCFETFPFPEGLTPLDTAHQQTETLENGVIIPVTPVNRAGVDIKDIAISIAQAGHRLNQLRENWLNPPEWVQRVPEVVPLGLDKSPYPDRIVSKAGYEKELAKRTLTNLYNQRPGWLDAAHRVLDVAVAHAYGWSDYTPEMADEEILQRLLALNLARGTPAMTV